MHVGTDIKLHIAEKFFVLLFGVSYRVLQLSYSVSSLVVWQSGTMLMLLKLMSLEFLR